MYRVEDHVHQCLSIFVLTPSQAGIPRILNTTNPLVGAFRILCATKRRSSISWPSKRRQSPCQRASIFWNTQLRTSPGFRLRLHSRKQRSGIGRCWVPRIRPPSARTYCITCLSEQQSRPVLYDEMKPQVFSIALLRVYTNHCMILSQAFELHPSNKVIMKL